MFHDILNVQSNIKRNELPKSPNRDNEGKQRGKQNLEKCNPGLIQLTDKKNNRAECRKQEYYLLFFTEFRTFANQTKTEYKTMSNCDVNL